MKLFKRWLILGVLAASLAAGFLPAAPAAAWSIGNNTLYFDKHKKHDLLSLTPPKHKGARHVESTKIDPEILGFTNYRELGTWDTAPVAEPSRIINFGESNLWLSITDSAAQQQATVQIKVEVLKNGSVEVTRQTGCVTLESNKSISKKIESGLETFDMPTPFPAIDFGVGDTLMVRVSVRDGSAVPGCVGGVKAYKVRFYYGGVDASSDITFEAAGAKAAAGLIIIGEPSFVDANGTLFVTPLTQITVPISIDANLSQCTIAVLSLSVPPAIEPVTLFCAQGPNALSFGNGMPLGPYDLRADVVVVLAGGVLDVRSDLVEVTLVDTVPSS